MGPTGYPQVLLGWSVPDHDTRNRAAASSFEEELLAMGSCSP
jgi:hypothetical protein